MPGISDIYLNNIKPVSEVPSSNVSGEGYSYLSSLKNGDTFSAKVVGSNGSDVTLRLPGGSLVNARLSSDMNITEGQTVSFEVKSSGSSISISPLLTNTATDPSVLKALNQASLPVTDTTVSMTSEMMKGGLSIDRNSLLQMYENIRSNPNAGISDMVDLSRLGLKVTPENLANIENYKNLSYQIDQGMKSLAEKTDQALMSMIGRGDTENAVRLMDTIIETALSENDFSAENVTSQLSEGTVSVSEDPAAAETAAGPASQNVQDDPLISKTVISDKENPLPEIAKPSAEADAVSVKVHTSENVISDTSNTVSEQTQVKDPAARALQLLKMMQEGADVKSPDSVNSGAGTDNKAVLNSENTTQPSDTTAMVSSRPELTTEEAFKQAVDAYKTVTGDASYQPSNLNEFLKDLSALTKTAVNDVKFDKLKELVSNDGTRKLVFDVLKDKWSISPSEVADKEKVESLYRRLSGQIRMISEGLVAAGAQNTPAFNAAGNMSSNIDFLQQINQMYAYIQLPLKLSGGDNAHGDLYVYSNRKNMSSDDSNVTAFLHLDMDHLGPVDVYVSMDVKAGGKVSTRFTVADDETLDFLSDHMDLLNDRLRKRGYELNCTMGVKGNDPDPEEDALDKGGVNLLLLHAGSGAGALSSGMRSFDVRA